MLIILKTIMKKGKQNPGGPTYFFHGKEVPYLVQLSPKELITSDIIVDIVATLYHPELFDQSIRKKHHLLIDGHGSCFELPFVKYVTNKDEWVIYLGVPYWTSMW